MIDLDAYFARIGYVGSRAPTLETLHAVTAAHTMAIPFENLDVLLGRAIALDEAALVEKLIRQHRGGYCFEQNGLLLLVLGQLGFSVRPLSGRVRFPKPREYLPPRTHLFVRVELGGDSWLTDCGVGSMSLTAAIRLVLDVEQETPHEPRRLVREGGVFHHQAKLAGVWHDVDEFTLEEMPPIDREVGNWWTSAHPQSSFKARLTAARALPNGERLSILNRELTHRRRDGSAEVQVIETPDALLTVLDEKFGLRFPAGTRFTCPALDWP